MKSDMDLELDVQRHNKRWKEGKEEMSREH